jgi:hypothetical protein
MKPTQPPIQWVPGLFRGKSTGEWRRPPSPSRAEVKERVQLYFYSPSGPSWPVLGWTLFYLYWSMYPGTVNPQSNIQQLAISLGFNWRQLFWWNLIPDRPLSAIRMTDRTDTPTHGYLSDIYGQVVTVWDVVTTTLHGVTSRCYLFHGSEFLLRN